MRKSVFSAILWLAVSLVFLSGCAVRAKVSGVPQMTAQPGKTTEGGKMRWLFPPNNIIIVVNSTTAPMKVNVYEARGRQQFSLEAGEQKEIGFRQLYQSQAVVVVSLCDPDSGVILDTASRTFWLTDNGGNVQTYDWVVRTNSSRRLIY